MSRTVAALYDTRAEAETARARLSSEINAQSRIIAQDTAAAIDTIEIAPRDAQFYREGLRRGGCLLVASVATGQSPERIIAILEQSARIDREGRESTWSREGWHGYDTGSSDRVAIEEERIPEVSEELRIGKRQVSRGGARVRSLVREEPAEQQVTLRDEHIEVENRPAERRLSIEEAEAAGLLKERVIEVSEMREEAVVTKEAFVREEVVVRKSVSERTETIRDTVRHTEVDVEELPATGRSPAFSQLSRGDATSRPADS